jgi:ribonucleoside-triphosphate reductase
MTPNAVATERETSSIMAFFPGSDPEFASLIDSLPRDLLALSGISIKKLDPFMNLKSLLTVGNYTVADLSSDPNANVAQATMASVLQESNKAQLKLYSMEQIFCRARDQWGHETAERIIRRIVEGGLYPSDLHLFLSPYCYNYSANWLMYRGLPFISRTPSIPARHADTFIQHVTQLIMYASNHQAGAAAITGFFVAYAWYAMRDGLTDEQVRQQLQNLVYTLNQPARYSAQTPFVNLSIFDRNYLQDLYGTYLYPDGTTPDIEYVLHLQKVFVEWFNSEIERLGTIFTFPVLTASILLDPKTRAPKDEEFVDWLVQANARYGLINIYMSDKAGSLSSCCRLSNDVSLLAELGYVNSFGAGGDSVGSVGVCTVNLPQVAYRANAGEGNFDTLLESYAEDAQRVVFIRRQCVEEGIQKGFFPLYEHGFIDLNSQYCTVGICGLFEAAEALGYADVDSGMTAYVNFAGRMIDRLNGVNLEAGKTYGVPFNLEQVPAENQAVNLAAKDRALGFQNGHPLYSNQWVPLTAPVDPFLRLHLAGELDKRMSGGAILHLSTSAAVSPEVQKKLLLYAARKGVVYFAFNYTLTACDECHAVVTTDASMCPKCGSNHVTKFTRVVGFVTPVRHWVRERRREFTERTRYDFDRNAVMPD